MRQVSSNSFEFFEPEQIDQANVVEYLASVSRNSSHKSGGETWACAWAPDNSFFAWSCGHRILHLVPWDSKYLKRYDPLNTEGLTGRKYHLIDCCETIWSLAFGSGLSENENSSRFYRHCRFDKTLILATGLCSGRIKLWDCFTGHLIIELLDHRDTVRCLDFTKDGSLQLLSASREGTLKLWDLHNDGNMYHTLKSQGVMFFGCNFSPNGKWIAAVGSAKSVLIWTVSAKNEGPIRLAGHHNDVVSCAFSNDSALLATASFDTKIIIWDTYSYEKIRYLGHLYPSPRLIFAGGANDHYVRNLSFSQNGCLLASVCDDGYVRFWNLKEDGDPVSISNVGDVVSCQFSSDGAVLAVGCRTGDAYFFSSPTRVASLKQLSRMAIRKQMPSNEVTKLPLPNILQQYLQYHDFYRGE